MSRSHKLALLAWLLLAGSTVLLAVMPVDRSLLMFYPQTALQQPWWQALSGHLLHLGNRHLAANLLALLLLLALAWRRGQLPQAWPVLLLSMLGVDLGLWLEGRVGWYVGLSGALHGLFAWLLLVRLPGAARPHLAHWLWLAGAAKVLLDVYQPQHHWLAIPVVPQAHVFGFACGSLLALASYRQRHASSDTPASNNKPV
ncbi:MAG: hypothetical protein QG667_2162 [Pseudomonadota bacterium]|jgi:rhomboid family GlyGly-CTERM serine protease|nr:hypothetical protein [Pseudomonadota bacterium]